jgi:hypothetical protein
LTSRATGSRRIGALVDHAKDQGALRPDVEGTEAIFIQVALTDVMDSTSHRSDVVPLLAEDFPRRCTRRPRSAQRLPSKRSA